MKDQFKAITLEWIKKAQSDYAFANASFREFDEFYSQICILCHDAAEKYLKGLIAAHGTKPERTHDLLNLLNTCLQLTPNEIKLVELVPSCRTLNRYYTPLKYPSHYPVMTKDQAKEAIEAIEAVKIAILESLNLKDIDNISK